MKKKLIKYINKNYKFDKQTKIALFCLIASFSGFFGFVYEFIFYFFNSGMKQFYYRGGNFLPWINIYMYGAFIICFLCFKRRKNPFKVFLISSFSCGLLELVSGFVMAKIRGGVRCWSYNEEILNFGNIGGYVCLRSVLFFGLSGLFLIYVILPYLFSLVKKVNKKTLVTLSVLLFSVILLDDLYNLIFARILSFPTASKIYKSLGVHYIYFYK